jgi:ERCC4-type nuclease
MLLKMPGIDLKNIHRVVSKVSDFKELLSLSESELSTVLESERNAHRLYDFLHAEHSKTEDAVAGGSTKAGGKRMMLNKFGAGGKRKR